jgi:hypothetical protein
MESPVPSSVYRVRISPADVGARVMVRRRLDDDGAAFGDLVGDLVSWSGDVLTIRTRTGEVAVEAATIVAGKRVPPPARRRGGRQ